MKAGQNGERSILGFTWLKNRADDYNKAYGKCLIDV
jgi:hypothetical protein